MSDAETEKIIEEGILDGSIGSDLLLIEEELIDDYVFGQLAPDEERSFEAKFLTSKERRDSLNFSRSITKYALERARSVRVLQRRQFLGILRVATVEWKVLLLTALGSIVLAAVWFGVRDMSLSRELAKTTRTSEERERLLDSLVEEEKGRSSVASTAGKASAEASFQPLPAPNAQLGPSIRLAPGITRGIERVPVLHLAGHSRVVWITLELPFEPEGGFREELLRADGERIWSQEFTAPGAMVSQRTTTIALPAQLLSPGDYQIKFKEVSTGGASDGGEGYVFRVTKK
jgi:hypothetical protein